MYAVNRFLKVFTLKIDKKIPSTLVKKPRVKQNRRYKITNKDRAHVSHVVWLLDITALCADLINATRLNFKRRLLI